MLYKTTYEITEIIELYHVQEVFIYDCIEKEWVTPVDTQKRSFDMEDITRILLIRDLKEEFGVNDEAVPIILHLIDQLHWSQAQIKHYIEILEK
ncbi:MAG TPA: chaperone modulator CbpM [Spirochaetota bacterium]|nr:chaperone modulator CbpM [Spirochaetota bacterium]HPS86678.1 chaperone modulator CbpM [Spirochaetota bacterium]